MRNLLVTLTLAAMLMLGVSALASGPPAPADTASVEPAPARSMDVVLDRIFANENQFVKNMRNYTPLAETYIQNYKPDRDLGEIPTDDHYFIGRLVVGSTVGDRSYDRQPGIAGRFLRTVNSFYGMEYMPLGFMQLIFLDNRSFSRANYDLQYLRREFLGSVRCMVFDVTPRKNAHGIHFLGRIWVEDQDYNIVRLNGTYVPKPKWHYYFHFDSWRINARPGVWVPAYVYTEETNRRYSAVRSLTMKGQTRFWGYDLKHAGQQEEFTNVVVDSPTAEIADRTGGGDNEISPVLSKRMWERQAEDNVMERLERAGVLAPRGEVDKVLETVVNNLELTNQLNIYPEVRCRVMMTTPLETYTIGHTIVISRGLLDVLPDEASLAMVISHELAHIALGHSLDTKYAFVDRMLFPDEQTFRRFGLARNADEENAADQTAMKYLQNSPYKDKLANAGLFLRALASESKGMPSLISPHFGNRIAKGNDVVRMTALLNSAPQLKIRDTAQVAALPLGGRIKVDPWDDHLYLQKSKPVPLLSSREKLSFEITPMFPNLTRYTASQEVASKDTK
jgi:hypothetical protein